jgi:hypothetical protein
MNSFWSGNITPVLSPVARTPLSILGITEKPPDPPPTNVESKPLPPTTGRKPPPPPPPKSNKPVRSSKLPEIVTAPPASSTLGTTFKETPVSKKEKKTDEKLIKPKVASSAEVPRISLSKVMSVPGVEKVTSIPELFRKSKDDKEKEKILKENFLDDQREEAEEQENITREQSAIEEQQLQQQIKEETEKQSIRQMFADIKKIKEKKRNDNLRSLLLQIKIKKARPNESIPIFQGYTDEQILQFIEEQFPPDAITILDTLESLTPAAVDKITEFIILKNQSVMVNSILDLPAPTDNKYNQLGIKSLSLPAVVDVGVGIPAVDGMNSSARALVECVADPKLCTPDMSEWRCCIGTDTTRFTDLATILATQNTTCLPFTTANPNIQAMVARCAGAGAGGDPNGFDDPFPSVIIGDENILYSIGPIIDDDKLLGRPLIMIRIYNYKTDDYTNGIYFWVYPSFSEGGANRVFLTLKGGKFMKGPDYTLTTFILDLLQVHINRYYTKHFVNKQGRGYTPTILNTQKQVICFFGGMLELQTLWVHDVIAGVGINLGNDPINPIPPGFNRHCYKFDGALPIKNWFNNGIPDINLLLGEPEVLVQQYALEFGRANQFTRGGRDSSSFPLCCCLTTISDRFNDITKTEINDFYQLFSRWNKTFFIQGCKNVAGISPVVAVVTGVSSDVRGMRYNPFIEHLTTPEVAKRFIQKRLVPPITTPETRAPFPSISMVSRSGSFLHKEIRFGSEIRIEEKPLLVVDLIPATIQLVEMQRQKGPVALTELEKTNIVFDTLPQALKTTINNILGIFFNPELFPLTSPSELQKIQVCFKCFLGMSHYDNPTTPDDLKQYIITRSIQNRSDNSIAIIPDSPLFRLIRTIDSGIYRNIIMSSILDEYTLMPTFPLDIPPDLDPVLMPQVRCSFLNEYGQYVEVPGGLGADSLGNCDFSSIFMHPLFRPYIFSATRKSMTFPPSVLDKYIKSPIQATPQRAQAEAQIPVKVHNKMFLMRLVFYTRSGAIQIIICVSSTISCLGIPPQRPPPFPYILFGVDVQFNVVSIGPLNKSKPSNGEQGEQEEQEEGIGLSTLATILATMNDYLSLGCMVAAKKGEYSKTAGYQQFLDYFDDFFRTIMTECFTYVSAYMSPFNCGKDLIMKHFGRVFQNFGDNPISAAIRQMWNWFPYLQHVQQDICTPIGIITQEMIEEAITSGRRNMQIVVQTFYDPILGILDDQAVGSITGDVGTEVGSVPSKSPGRSSESPGRSSESSVSSMSDDDLQRLRRGDFSDDSISTEYQYMSSQASQEPSLSPDRPVRMEGGGRTNKKTRKYRKNRSNNTQIQKIMRMINRRGTRKQTHKNKKGNNARKNTTSKNTTSKNTTSKNKTMKIKSKKFPKRIYLYSTPRIAQRMAYKYLGRTKTAKLYPARNPAKKYMVFDPKNNKWVNFGQMGYEDYTKHHDKTRRKNYLTRTKNMGGDWKSNKYSANNLARSILWN